RARDGRDSGGVTERSLVARVQQHAGHGGRTAIVDPGGTWSYDELAVDAARLASVLLGDRDDLAGGRVAVLCTPGRDFVTALLACWQAGGIAVPLHPGHPDPELEYFLTDSEAGAVVASRVHSELARRLAERTGAGVAPVDAAGATRARPAVDLGRR